MNKHDFLLFLEELTESDPNTLKGTEYLSDLERWDSLVVLGFIALVDEKFEMSIPPKRIAECKKVDDLIALLGDKVKDADPLAA